MTTLPPQVKIPEWAHGNLTRHAWYNSYGDRDRAIRNMARHYRNMPNPVKEATKDLDRFLEKHPEIKNFDFEAHWKAIRARRKAINELREREKVVATTAITSTTT